MKVCFGTDVVFSRDLIARQSKELTARQKWFTPVEIHRQATSTNGELLAQSGRRNPYGKLGVIEEGALAKNDTRLLRRKCPWECTRFTAG